MQHLRHHKNNLANAFRRPGTGNLELRDHNFFNYLAVPVDLEHFSVAFLLGRNSQFDLDVVRTLVVELEFLGNLLIVEIAGV